MNRTLLLCLLALLACASARADDSARTWHVLAVAENGTITLLKGLTKHEADYTAARLMGLPATPGEVKQEAGDRAAEAEAARVQKLREDEKLRKILPVCVKEGEPDYQDPIWIKFTNTVKSVDTSKFTSVSGCHSKNGDVHIWGMSGSLGSIEAGYPVFNGYRGKTEPWTAYESMKSAEVFQ
jgi:hypothetical protein